MQNPMQNPPENLKTPKYLLLDKPHKWKLPLVSTYFSEINKVNTGYSILYLLLCRFG